MEFSTEHFKIVENQDSRELSDVLLDVPECNPLPREIIGIISTKTVGKTVRPLSENITDEDFYELADIDNITELHLKGCSKITTIPIFPQLKKLVIDNCKHLASLPGSLERSKKFTSSPDSLESFPELQYLNINDCDKLIHISLTAPNLKVLEIMYCDKLIDIINDFSELVYFKCVECRHLKNIICNFEKLRICHLALLLELIQFPQNLPTVEYFYVWEYNDCINKILMPEVKYAFISNNVTEPLPDWTYNLKGLAIMDYGFPSSYRLNLPNLEMFDGNNIGGVSELNFPNCRYLHLYNLFHLKNIINSENYRYVRIHWCKELKAFGLSEHLQFAHIENCKWTKSYQYAVKDLKMEGFVMDVVFDILQSWMDEIYSELKLNIT